MACSTTLGLGYGGRGEGSAAAHSRAQRAQTKTQPNGSLSGSLSLSLWVPISLSLSLWVSMPLSLSGSLCVSFSGSLCLFLSLSLALSESMSLSLSLPPPLPGNQVVLRWRGRGGDQDPAGVLLRLCSETRPIFITVYVKLSCIWNSAASEPTSPPGNLGRISAHVDVPGWWGGWGVAFILGVMLPVKSEGCVSPQR